ncbi:MAG: hypothetical protein ACLQL2_01040 [Methylovirgula sp.]
MEFHCNSIVFTMPKSDDPQEESFQFTISLPKYAIDLIEGPLAKYQLYGRKRATICQRLILEKLRDLYPPPPSDPQKG